MISRHLALVALILIPSLSMADGKTLFKRRPVEGQVFFKKDNSIEIKTQKVIEETITKVTLTGDTKVRRGLADVNRESLHEGDSVSVIGTKLPSGELVAREIVIGSANEDSNH
jgi:hypothetical protein